MARINLPNPDMDFTPLDVLTAADMDKMVANDKALIDAVNSVADGSGIADGSIGPDKIGSSMSVQFGGGGLDAGANTKTFTPTSNGLLVVSAGGRRNASSPADLIISISATGVSNPYSQTGVQYGTGVFASASFIGKVSKGAQVSINVNVSGGSIANGNFQFYVIPLPTVAV